MEMKYLDIYSQLNNIYLLVLESHNGYKKGDIIDFNTIVVLGNNEVYDSLYAQTHPIDPKKVAMCNEGGEIFKLENTYIKGTQPKVKVYFKESSDYFPGQLKIVHHFYCNEKAFTVENDGNITKIPVINPNIVIVEGSLDDLERWQITGRG